MADPVRLAELVCARLSHDLGGLLGSLTGVLDLAREAAGGSEEELALAVETAQEIAGRLRLLRAAWGGGSGAVAIAELQDFRRGITGHRRVRLDLSGLAEHAVLPPQMACLALNVMLLAAESLPRGGTLSLSGDQPDQRILAQLAGVDAAWPAGFAAMLADPQAAWAALSGPRTLQAPLTALMAGRCGIRLSFLMAASPSAPGAPPPLLLAAAPN
jgi:histidine phosphotransferase ChpT